MKHITLEQLESFKACKDQLDEFTRLFPDGKALVTIKHAKELAGVFDWDWAAKKLLQPNTNKTYAAAMAEVDKAYWAAMAEVDKAFDAAMDEVNKAYWAARAEADKSRAAARAEAFARAYLVQPAKLQPAR